MKYRLLTLLVLSAGFSGSVIGDDDIERIEVKGHRILDFKPGFVSFNLGHGFPIATKYGRYEPRDRGDKPKSRGGLNDKQNKQRIRQCMRDANIHHIECKKDLNRLSFVLGMSAIFGRARLLLKTAGVAVGTWAHKEGELECDTALINDKYNCEND